MAEFLATFLAFSLMVTALALGTAYWGVRLHGSCGEARGGDAKSLCSHCSVAEEDCSLKSVKRAVAEKKSAG